MLALSRRSVTPLALLGPLAVAHAVLAQPLPPPAGSPARVGPSFDCAAGHSPITDLICSSADLSRIDLTFVQAYYALRQQVGETGWQALKAEALDFQNRTMQRCGVPATGSLPPEPGPWVVCLSAAYERQRAVWLSRLSGPAAEEAGRPIEQHIALQRDLQTLGFLPPTATIDGVYGAATRLAILAWQRTRVLPASGFLDDHDATVLAGPPSPPSTSSQPDPLHGEAPNGGSNPQGNDTAALSADQRGAIRDHVRECWTYDPDALGVDQMQVMITVTTDPAGVARSAVVADPDVAKLADPVFRAFAERARLTVLDPHCANLPLPPNLMGKTNVLTFRFSPPPEPSGLATNPPSQARRAEPDVATASGWYIYSYPTERCEPSGPPADQLHALQLQQIIPTTEDVTDADNQVVQTSILWPNDNGTLWRLTYFRGRDRCEAFAKAHESNLDRYK